MKPKKLGPVFCTTLGPVFNTKTPKSWTSFNSTEREREREKTQKERKTEKKKETRKKEIKERQRA